MGGGVGPFNRDGGHFVQSEKHPAAEDRLRSRDPQTVDLNVSREVVGEMLERELGCCVSYLAYRNAAGNGFVCASCAGERHDSVANYRRGQ